MIINNKALYCNQNSLMTIQEYFKSVHGLALPEDVIRIKADSHCGPQLTLLWQKRSDIEENAHRIENNPETDVVCGLTIEVISGKPVKINNKFYDYNAFHAYMMQERKKYFEAKETGTVYEPLCPRGKKLPDDIYEVFTDRMLTSSTYLVLDHNFFNCVEEYEDLIANVMTTKLGNK